MFQGLMNSPDDSRYLGIDLFSGAGGMSLGAHLAGIETTYAVECQVDAAQTYARNFPDCHVLNQKIEDVDCEVFKRVNSDRLVLFGGAPCQGFSTSNQKTRNVNNQSNWLFRHFLRFVSELRPRWVVFENVKGLTETALGFFFEEILASFRALGYQVQWKILNASDFGVPQNRFRVFIIANRDNEIYSFPIPNEGLKVTVKDAIGDLPILENGASCEKIGYTSDPLNKYQAQIRQGSDAAYDNYVTRSADIVLDRYRHIPQGGNWTSIPESLHEGYSDMTRCHTGIYHRLHDNRPSVVVGNYRKNMLIHPTQDRGLSVREAARIQSFPDIFRFSGSIGFQQQQVGNAVPPLLSMAIFNAIK